MTLQNLQREIYRNKNKTFDPLKLIGVIIQSLSTEFSFLIYDTNLHGFTNLYHSSSIWDEISFYLPPLKKKDV